MNVSAEGGGQAPSPSFSVEISRDGIPNLSLCFQCMKCTNGCPAAFAMDIPPHRLVHLAKLGFFEEVLGSRAIWVCSSCQTCTSGCPNQIDIAKLLDVFRGMAIRSDLPIRDEGAVVFHEALLGQVRLFGRVFELGMLMKYKLKTGKYFDDLFLGLKMMLKGRFGFFPRAIQGRLDIRRIMSKKTAAK